MSPFVRVHPALPGAAFATLPLEGLIVRSERLAEAERTIYANMTGTEARRLEWYAGRVATRAALEAVGGHDLAVLRAESGAPRLEGRNADAHHVAITHGKRLAAAVAAKRGGPWPHVGIDIVDAEDLDRIRKIARRVLKPKEQERAADPLHARLAWGAREAIAKATNTGMFVFALAQCWTEGVDETTRSVRTNLDEVSVIYEMLDDGGVLILAGATENALLKAQAAAFPRS